MTTPTLSFRPAPVSAHRWCPACAAETLFVMPCSDEHDPQCLELVCSECDAAVLL